jgi:hypothetical protein
MLTMKNRGRTVDFADYINRISFRFFQPDMAVDELRKIEMKELKEFLKKEEYDGLKGVLSRLAEKERRPGA